MPTSEIFRLNNTVLFNRIEEIKKNPPPEILAYKAAHPEFKTVNCTLLADYIGMSESTLQNLKLGKTTDSNCSTAKLICTKLNIDIRDLFGFEKTAHCDPATCTSHSQARLDEKRQRIAELEAAVADRDKELARLRSIIKEQSVEFGAAKAKAEGLERIISEKDGCISRRDAGVRRRNRIIITMVIVWGVIIIADLLLANFGWFRFGPIK